MPRHYIPVAILFLASLACSLTGGRPAPVPSPAAAPETVPSATAALEAPAPTETPVDKVSAIAAGALHMCRISSAGQVSCWGSTSSNQVGGGTMLDKNTPTPVIGLSSDMIAVTAGGEHTCALTAAGAVKCWGRNVTGQLGDGTNLSRLSVINVTGLESGITAISAGYDHTCAVTSAGGVKCWGKGLYGRLGDGKGSRWSGIPVDVSGLSEGVAAVAAGDEHTCALMTEGRMKCWGYNDLGQLGTGTAITMSKVPVDVVGLEHVKALAVGASRSCAVTQAGRVLCWGWDGMEQVFDIPNPVDNVRDAVSVTIGLEHACAVTGDGKVLCWGVNTVGQLGDGSTRNSISAVMVKGLNGRAMAISAGFHYTCALLEDGQVQCWGAGIPGRSGNSSARWNSVPPPVHFRN